MKKYVLKRWLRILFTLLMIFNSMNSIAQLSKFAGTWEGINQKASGAVIPFGVPPLKMTVEVKSETIAVSTLILDSLSVERIRKADIYYFPGTQVPIQLSGAKLPERTVRKKKSCGNDLADNLFQPV